MAPHPGTHYQWLTGRTKADQVHCSAVWGSHAVRTSWGDLQRSSSRILSTSTSHRSSLPISSCLMAPCLISSFLFLFRYLIDIVRYLKPFCYSFWFVFRRVPIDLFHLVEKQVKYEWYNYMTKGLVDQPLQIAPSGRLFHPRTPST